MSYQDPNYCLPIPYASLPHLHHKLGDIETVECVCYIWNKFHTKDTLRVKGDDGVGTIFITGKCSDVDEALNICRYLTTWGVLVKHEPTIETFTVEY